MFNTWDKFSLWKTLDSSLKLRDTQTQLMEYEGSERGQTQRYMVIISSIIKELFNKIAEMHEMSYLPNTNDVFLQELLTKNSFLVLSDSDRSYIVYMLRNMVKLWAMRGNVRFVRFITEIVYGFTILGYTEVGEDIFLKYYKSGETPDLIDNTLFTNNLPAGKTENNVLYDRGLIRTQISVLVQPGDADKKESYESFINEYCYSLGITYT